MDLEELLRRYGRGERNFIAINVPDLMDVDLEGINLTRSNLGGCILENVNLKNANLSQAYLNGSQMTKVNLDKAKLIQADISECKWIEVSLVRAKLIQSDLSFSFFEICNFRNARGADLSDLAGNTLQEVVLPNGKVVDRQIWESFN